MPDYGSDPVILEARPDRSWCKAGRQFAAGAAPATHRTAHGQMNMARATRDRRGVNSGHAEPGFLPAILLPSTKITSSS
jgi:hypothetical protein